MTHVPPLLDHMNFRAFGTHVTPACPEPCAPPLAGSWEQPEIDEVLWAMEQPVPGEDGNGTPDSKLFVDIGANVAWFTVNVAARGYTVAAFEGAVDCVCVGLY